MDWEKQYFTKYVCPANPIISKKITSDQGVKLKVLQESQMPADTYKNYNNPPEDDFNSDEEFEGRLTLLNAYHEKSLMFQKWSNLAMRSRNNKSYFASVFTNLSAWPERSEKSLEIQGIRFDSSEESMNLFAVFQVAENQYDLVLQNDLNTSGYTQWFYFSICNRSRNQKIKLNIVNLYKSRSLYSDGMKPVIMSMKSKKGWVRGGTSVYYSQNQINYEYNKRCFYTLSFQHTFLAENDTTYFAHCYPYPTSQLKQTIKEIEKSPKVQVRTLGQTCLKKNLQIVEISQEDSNPNKKALIIMARQHPGETVGSYIMDQIMQELVKNSTEAEFLLWRFNIYCIPMVNMDGVDFGNYRGNAYGFDLNRSWDRENMKRLPQISLIKKQVKRIQKKYPIEMVLDLHGHSRKMGSFFYGNPYGKNTGIFALVASKTSSNISFGDSTFRKEKTEKITTARVILGNIIKDTGCFYTYETSFFGSYVNNRKVHFTVDSLRELGRNLISAASKTFLEIQKQEKSLKESIFLREARKQLTQKKQIDNDEDSGSDSEAEMLTMKELKIKNIQIEKQSMEQLKNSVKQMKEMSPSKHRSVEIQVGEDDFYTDEKGHRKSTIGTPSKSAFRIHESVKYGSSQKYSLQVSFQMNEQEKQVRKNTNDPLNRKHFLMQKLRIFGETFIEPNPKDKNKETQTLGEPLSILGQGKQAIGPIPKQESSPLKYSVYRKKRNRNKSLILKGEQKQKLHMADIVKVNRLEYKKIKRDSMNELSNKSNVTYQQLLPFIG